MHNKYKLRLNLFGEGGEGAGEGAAAGAQTTNAETGDNGETAARKRLMDLGVPENRLRKNRAYASQKVTAAPAEQTEEPKAEEEAQKPTRMSWKDIMADPEYNAEMQRTVQERLKKSKGAEETLQKLAPVLEALGAKYSIDTSDMSKLDIDGLIGKVSQDNSYYEEMAMDKGVTVEQARLLDQAEKLRAREEAKRNEDIIDQQMRRHYESLVEQGNRLAQTVPGFSLEEELKNPRFMRMTSPQGGCSVEDAYFAIHRNELQAQANSVIASKAQQKIANAVQANRSRPTENGSQASSLSSIDYSKMTRTQREALKAQIHRAAARGEKLYPSDVFGRR